MHDCRMPVCSSDFEFDTVIDQQDLRKGRISCHWAEDDL